MWAALSRTYLRLRQRSSLPLDPKVEGDTYTIIQMLETALSEFNFPKLLIKGSPGAVIADLVLSGSKKGCRIWSSRISDQVFITFKRTILKVYEIAYWNVAIK